MPPDNQPAMPPARSPLRSEYFSIPIAVFIFRAETKLAQGQEGCCNEGYWTANEHRSLCYPSAFVMCRRQKTMTRRPKNDHRSL